MDKINTGGPAFPAQFDFSQQDDLSRQEGMTLRDYFAGQALMTIESFFHKDNNPLSPEEAAVAAYEVADAMIKQSHNRAD